MAKSVSLIISNGCLKSALPYLQGEFMLPVKAHCPLSSHPTMCLSDISCLAFQDKEIVKEKKLSTNQLTILHLVCYKCSNSLCDKTREKVLSVHWWSQKGWVEVAGFKLTSGKALPALGIVAFWFFLAFFAPQETVNFPHLFWFSLSLQLSGGRKNLRKDTCQNLFGRCL